ncbi:MAG: hypothetical protein GY814_20495 [Gammaproteobacteria bacterium]|nr:hypothetical protein [Gammaproteobacteria bacterium]
MPTATSIQYLVSHQGEDILAHSLGTLDATNLAGLGLAGNVSVNALPFLNIAPAGVNVTISSGDLINGFGLGKVFNTGAREINGPLFGHRS